MKRKRDKNQGNKKADNKGAPQGEQGKPQAAVVRPNQVTQLVELVRKRGAELFHDAKGTAYIAAEVDGHRVIYPLMTKTFRQWLGRQAFKAAGGAIPHQTVE